MRSGAMEGPRTLHTMIPSYTGTFNNGTRNWEVDIDSATGQMSFGWQVGGNNTIVYETYFDLDGYSMDDLTFFPLMPMYKNLGYILLPSLLHLIC